MTPKDSLHTRPQVRQTYLGPLSHKILILYSLDNFMLHSYVALKSCPRPLHTFLKAHLALYYRISFLHPHDTNPIFAQPQKVISACGNTDFRPPPNCPIALCSVYRTLE